MAVGALMPKNTTTISFDGPFFEKDVALTYGQNLDRMLLAMAKEAAADVRAQVAQHQGDMPYWTGFSLGQIASRVHQPWREYQNFRLVWPSTANIPGRPEALHASGGKSKFRGNAAAIVMAAASSIEGRWHPYRTTKNRLNRSRAVNMAELTKGLE